MSDSQSGLVLRNAQFSFQNCYENFKQGTQYRDLHNDIRLINWSFEVGQLDILSCIWHDHISSSQFSFLEVLHNRKYCQPCNNLHMQLLNHRLHGQYCHCQFCNNMYLLLLMSSISSLSPSVKKWDFRGQARDMNGPMFLH